MRSILVAAPLPVDHRETFETCFTGDRMNGMQVIALWANDVAVAGVRGMAGCRRAR